LSGYLLDTGAVSLLFNGRASRDFTEWLGERQGALFLSVVTLQEIEKGASKIARMKGGSAEKAGRMEAWLQGLVLEYQDKILPISATVALAAGRIEGTAIARGHNGGLADILIAATAEVHGLVVITENLKDFEALGIRCEAPC
jgi:toxin FitB